MGLNIWPLVVGIVQLVVGLILAISAIYLGIYVFDKSTRGIDEKDELKKGNTAVGLVLSAVILSIANVIQSGVVGLTAAITANPTKFSWAAILGGLIQLIVGIILAVLGIYIALSILNKIMREINLMEAIKKGNNAIAILMAAVLVAVSFILQAGISGIASAIGISI